MHDSDQPPAIPPAGDQDAAAPAAQPAPDAPAQAPEAPPADVGERPAEWVTLDDLIAAGRQVAERHFGASANPFDERAGPYYLNMAQDFSSGLTIDRQALERAASEGRLGMLRTNEGPIFAFAGNIPPKRRGPGPVHAPGPRRFLVTDDDQGVITLGQGVAFTAGPTVICWEHGDLAVFPSQAAAEVAVAQRGETVGIVWLDED